MDAEIGKYRLCVESDPDPESPREYAVGTMVTWHKRYTLGEEQPSEQPAEWLAAFEADNPNAVILPVFAYIHGGIVLTTGPFACPWDSGQVGWIYTTHNPDTDGDLAKWREAAPVWLEQEIETYSQFLSGDVWCYTLEQRVECSCPNCKGWHHVDSCGGFYGTDWDTNGMAHAIGEQVGPKIAGELLSLL
jgi:hypothetical protein